MSKKKVFLKKKNSDTVEGNTIIFVKGFSTVHPKILTKIFDISIHVTYHLMSSSMITCLILSKFLNTTIARKRRNS